MPKSEDLSRSLEINAIWTFDTEFPTIFNKSCTYITFKSAVKHRQLGYGYPRGHIIYKSSQKTRHKKLNSYWVMNSLGDKICPPAAPSTPVNKIARGTCIFIMHTFIHIFYFNHLGESALLCGQTVPEAIHNQVAIKLLKSGLLI